MDIDIESPVSVGLPERIVAYLIDNVLAATIGTLIFFIVAFSTSVDGYYFDLLDFLLYLIFSYCYYVFLPFFWDGQTVGKRIMGLKIVNVTGEKLTLSQLLIRGLFHGALYLVGWLLTVISIILIIVRDDNRALHDILTTTYVSYNRR
ncbi:RDD family protein [Ornithinibacillus halophilus]|uniref:Uncharacterized membrane protein YckC, RDD family n=1 Tax=Ornithinibacillus halophilus TaxID=930117 RepID=A0A1M5JXL5_9BACI|nr:RDD family protein [Ornithinibacillus halophilus]SHG44979.1 Uncharacterized membrane protein YckC, RDD family [Ornithinibacillus halophilus]